MLVNCKVLTRVDHMRLLKMSRSFREVSGPARAMAAVLESELAAAVKVPGERVDADLVTMNSKVRVCNFRTDRTLEVTVVFPIDADLTRGRISVLAPLGRALLGARVGETVPVRTSAGTAHYFIQAMLYQPETSIGVPSSRAAALFPRIPVR